jgi:hypothetical protein
MSALGRLWRASAVVGGLAAACSTSPAPPTVVTVIPPSAEQTPGWSRDDLDAFLHGSMSAEVVPERVLRAFARAYPDLFPTADLTGFGLVADPAFGWPIGVSRRAVAHLGGQPSIGINCAACHSGEVVPVAGGPAVRVLGMPSLFDAEAFFGALTIATFRTLEPAGMRRFLAAYVAVDDPTGTAEPLLAAAWPRQESRIVAAMATEPFLAKDLGADTLYGIDAGDLRLDRRRLVRGDDLVPVVRALLRLFHNIRTALHIPHQPPTTPPPASGPGRNDAFGLLSLGLFGVPQPYAPVKYGVVWNLQGRRWVHWDGNTQSPIGRNLLAALGLGAPLVGGPGRLDLAAVQRQTDLSETVRAPRYPFAIDTTAAARGAAPYAARCAGCHEGPEADTRLRDVGTDPTRAQAFTPAQAERFNAFLAGLQAPGYRPPTVPGLRGTQRYWTPSLAGVWARAPYLHNGSVRTLRALLAPPAARAITFRRGTPRYDTDALGYADEGRYVVDTRTPGNDNAGHAFGVDLSAADKRDLVEFLKTK